MSQFNRYQKVIKMAEIVKKLEQEDRKPKNVNKNNFIKTVNETKKIRKYVLEAEAVFKQEHENNDEKNDENC